MADRPIWKLEYKDPAWEESREYMFDPQKLLTVSALRQIKGWYGTEIGRYLTFINAFAQGDPEAVVCALWLARRDAGEDGVPEPNKMPDFSVGDFFSEFIAADDDEDAEVDPTQPSTPAQTPALTETPTRSEPSTSVSSPVSAES
jgi:hypothetical protein